MFSFLDLIRKVLVILALSFCLGNMSFCLEEEERACSEGSPHLNERIVISGKELIILYKSPNSLTNLGGHYGITNLGNGHYLASATICSGVPYYETKDGGESWKLIAIRNEDYEQTLFQLEKKTYIIANALKMTEYNPMTQEFYPLPEPLLNVQCYYKFPCKSAGGDIVFHSSHSTDYICLPLDERAMCTKANADLTRPLEWFLSNPANEIDFPRYDNDFTFLGEGTLVEGPNGNLKMLYRLFNDRVGGRAAMFNIEVDKEGYLHQSFERYIDFPGGATKFVILKSEITKSYLSLVNDVQGYKNSDDAAGTRNRLSLIESNDLIHWRIRENIIDHPDKFSSGFQYVDFKEDVESRALIMVIRMGYGFSNNFHDANHVAFYKMYL